MRGLGESSNSVPYEGPNGAWLPRCPNCGCDAAPIDGEERLFHDARCELHTEAMNTRCEPTIGIPAMVPTDAYKFGHRDARHAIAEMLVSHPAWGRLVAQLTAAREDAARARRELEEERERGREQ